MGTLRPINPHTASLIINPQAAAHDYDNLTHKPQINGHELSGDQSGSDLGLQNQLTAGDNVTIENGVISAEGGTDDYNDLGNKPSINNVTLSGNKTAEDLNLQPVLPIGSDNELVDAASSGVMKRSGYRVTTNENVIADRASADGFIANARAVAKKLNGITQIKIVSGAVDANGHITFTDSDGQTFTTSGSSVIGDDGFSPTATVTQTASGATVSITDKNGTTTANISNGADGQDYVLTSQDKTDIANIVLQLLPTTQGVLYGNTSN